ncbi:MAG: hypothetical protein JRJ39_00355 [Deltaproteobacteria bacterium]|nr:hypothetical protein [Deltaproteobacteria bacterium]MBW1845559.1 hypothetical protein [Deltaproteobacteria bacterium]MBW2031989.1 hypothetical protein [Deltaproteobacteria bacterium]
MSRYGTNNNVIEAFFDQAADGPTGAGNVYWEDKKTLYSYGRHFPLAYKLRSGSYLFNGDKYSSSTGRHQSETAAYRDEGRGDITISFSALQAAGIEYDSESLHIVSTQPDQQEDFYFDPKFYGKAAREDAEKFIKSAPKGATVRFQSWKDKEGERQQAPSYWHRPAAAVLMWDAWTETKLLFENHQDPWKSTGERKVKHPVKYFILGMDEGSYFISQLPGPAASVGKAYDILKPKAIRQAEARGEKIQRQGEWFFYPIFEGSTARQIYKQLDPKFNLTDASNRPGAAHIATRGGRLSQVAFLTAEKTAKHFKHALRHCDGSQIIVSGQIRHSEGDHAQLKLSTIENIKIFSAHINTALASWSSSGGVD